jgi:hypothetical protein
VRVRPVSGDERLYVVLTWLGQEKAIAIATRADIQWHSGTDGLYDLEIEEVGPAPRTASGTVELGSDLHDRMEF